MSIQTMLRWLVAISLLPFAGSAVILWAGDSRLMGVLGMPALGEGSRVSVGWLWWALGAGALTSAALSHTLVRQITGSVRRLAEAASKLADGLPVETQPTHIKETAAVASALERVSALLRERTAERDQATAAEERLRRAGQQLQHRASHDALTGLINRSRFDEVLGERVAACDSGGAPLTLLYIDVDGFKRVNDQHGHACGDELLRLFAARIKSNVRESEVVARLGGDEFAVILSHAQRPQSLETADRLIDQLSRPYRLGPLSVEVSASIGLATYPGSATCASTLLQAADAAMYRAKNAGKCRHVSSGFGSL